MTAVMTVVEGTGEMVPIADIVVGDRVRKDYGDLDTLAASIQQRGLLQPIGLAPGNHLLFGFRRLQAVQRLGWAEVSVTRPATQTDALSLLKAERDENVCRKPMTPEELVDLGLRIEELERPKAQQRIREGSRRGGEVFAGREALPPGEGRASKRNHKGETNTIVGEALGLTRSTYGRARTVVQTARGQHDDPPEVQAVAQQALQEMNAGEQTINGAYEQVRAARPPRPPARPPELAIPQPPKYGPRRSHLQMLQALTTALDGYTVGVEEITALDSSVTAEEAVRLKDDLSRQTRSLDRIKKLLKERIA